MFRTLTAKYAATCRRCGLSIPAGQRIRYGGPGRIYHLAADCPVSQQATQAPLPATQPADRYPVAPVHALESSAEAAGDWSVDAAMAEAYGREYDPF
jgi:hypothetical protein